MNPAEEMVLNRILLKISNLINKLRLRQVSKAWGNLIEEIFEKDNLWKKLCSNDYIYPWVYNIVEIIFKERRRDWSRPLLPTAWKRIYLFYNQWSSKVTSTDTFFQLSGIKEHTAYKGNIYSIDVQADMIAININQKKIIIFQINNIKQGSTEVPGYSPILSYKRRKISRKIMRIKLWFTNTLKLILIIYMISKAGNRTLKYLDVSTGKKIYNPFRNQNNIHNFTCASHRLFIATSKSVYECKYTENNVLVLGQHIFEFWNIFNRREMDKLNVLEMSAKSILEADKLSLLIKIAADGVRVITFIISRDEDAMFRKLDCDRDIRIRVTESLFYMPMPGMVFITSETEMIINLWYNITETHIKINDDWERIVTLRAPEVLDLSREYESPIPSDEIRFDENLLASSSRMLKAEPMKITSMLFFCNILFLGLQSGDIEIYIADSVKSLIRYDFYQLPKRRLKISTYPITNINIVVRHGTILIIATTTKAMYINPFNYD